MSNGTHAALLIEDVIKSINRLSDRIGSLERRMGAAEPPAQPPAPGRKSA